MPSKKKLQFRAAIARPTQTEIEILAERDISRAPGREVTPADIPALLELGEKMHRAMSGEHGKFAGPYPNAYAIAHQQVERDHLRAFFVRRDIAFVAFDGEQIILNPSWEPEGTAVTEIREGCMTHGGRGDRKTRRFAAIAAKFQIPSAGELKDVRVVLTALAARIFQHETDHTDGKTIYSDRL